MNCSNIKIGDCPRFFSFPQSAVFRRGIVFALAFLSFAQWGIAREIHVSKKGSLNGDGALNNPMLTLDQAVQAATPGDVVLVHEGTYREVFSPAIGGSSETRRITYKAAPGEKVYIKGSERITSWESQGSGVWQATLPNTMFNGYNPFAKNVSGDFLNYGLEFHLADVFLNGKDLNEVFSSTAVNNTANTWYASVNDSNTVLLANFAVENPNTAMVEINVREHFFQPKTAGLGFITIERFHFMHAACNWVDPTSGVSGQSGAINTFGGKYWNIVNNTLEDVRTVAITLTGGSKNDNDIYHSIGNHIVRYNTIRRCGEGGIHGRIGASRSTISHNLIELINYRKEFGGWETAGIKFHHTVDAYIANNIIRDVMKQDQAAYGIWIDFGNQGTWICGNIIYRTDIEAIFLEMNNGGILCEKNILVGKGFRNGSRASAFAHNLIIDGPQNLWSDPKRSSAYFTPHTREQIDKMAGGNGDDKWYNNLFIKRGTDTIAQKPDFVLDYNLYLEGAKKTTYADTHSVESGHKTGYKLVDHPQGVTITFAVDGSPFGMNNPLVNAALIGQFKVVKQSIEDKDGNPITIAVDINGLPYSPVIPGPFADLKKGENSYTFTAGSTDLRTKPW
jgi:hypothetical protein